MSHEAQDQPRPAEHPSTWPRPLDPRHPLLATMMLALPADRMLVYDGCVIVFEDVAEPMDFLVNHELTSVGTST